MVMVCAVLKVCSSRESRGTHLSRLRGYTAGIRCAVESIKDDKSNLLAKFQNTE